MSNLLPEVSKQIRSKDILEVLEKNFVSVIPVWAPLQLANCSGAQTGITETKFFSSTSSISLLRICFDTSGNKLDIKLYLTPK